MNDDQLKALRESLRISETEALAIIDEALSRGAKRDSDSDAFILALTELTRERDEARAALAKATDDRDAAMVALEIRTESLANARAVAFAEAVARLRAWIADYEAINDDRGASVMEAAVAAIRALSSSPPSGQWVAADVMERVKAALMRKRPTWGSGKDMRESEAEEASFESDRRAALSALESEASR